MMESVDPETGQFYDASAEDNLHQSRSELRICGHCCQVMQGYASLGDTWLCHPDGGLDCYSAVTLHKHPMRCTVCNPSLEYSTPWAAVRAEMMRDWTPEQLDRYFRTVEQAKADARVRYANEIRQFLGIDRIRTMYRRRKR